MQLAAKVAQGISSTHDKSFISMDFWYIIRSEWHDAKKRLSDLGTLGITLGGNGWPRILILEHWHVKARSCIECFGCRVIEFKIQIVIEKIELEILSIKRNILCVDKSILFAV